MRTPLVARISTTALVEGSMLKASNVRSGMRLTEAGQFDAMRSTCDHTQRAKHKNSRYFLVIANVVIKQLLLPQAANVTIRR